MTNIKKLDEPALHAALAELPAWRLVAGKLHREYVFRDFVEAFSFMTHMALVAQRHDHHPEWFNSYKKVTVDLTTHEAAGITSRDLVLAREMARLAGQA